MSIYPPTIARLISTLYHKLIEPRVKVYNEPITIMWTPSSGIWNVNDPVPRANHFVPVFKAVKNLPSPLSELKKCELDIVD